jgi:hypothetical protein
MYDGRWLNHGNPEIKRIIVQTTASKTERPGIIRNLTLPNGGNPLEWAEEEVKW